MERITPQPFGLKFLTPIEVSEMFQMPVRTIHALARQGKLPGIKIGRLWRFRLVEIHRWVEVNYQGTSDFPDIHAKAKEILDTCGRL